MDVGLWVGRSKDQWFSFYGVSFALVEPWYDSDPWMATLPLQLANWSLHGTALLELCWSCYNVLLYFHSGHFTPFCLILPQGFGGAEHYTCLPSGITFYCWSLINRWMWSCLACLAMPCNACLAVPAGCLAVSSCARLSLAEYGKVGTARWTNARAGKCDQNQYRVAALASCAEVAVAGCLWCLRGAVYNTAIPVVCSPFCGVMASLII